MLLSDDLFVPEDGSSFANMPPQKTRCVYYPSCRRPNCPYLHEDPQSDFERPKVNNTVCNKWLKGDCLKGDQCTFLHEYDYNKIPICSTYATTGKCTTQRCRHRHPPNILSSTTNITGKPCNWYYRGFCKHGGNCKDSHEFRGIFCPAFMAGFCPKGPNCHLPHPNFEKKELIQSTIESNAAAAAGIGSMAQGSTEIGGEAPRFVDESEVEGLLRRVNFHVPGTIICHKCGEKNHKSMKCMSTNPLPPERQGNRAIVGYFVKHPDEWFQIKRQLLNMAQQQQSRQSQPSSSSHSSSLSSQAHHMPPSSSSFGQPPRGGGQPFAPRFMAPPFFNQPFY